MCGELGLSEAGISLCLDHQANKDENGKPLPAVTHQVYNLATRNRVAKKREVLDAWAIELRRIIGTQKSDCGSPPDPRPQFADMSSPVSAKLAGLFLLKSGETRCLAADAFGVLPGVW